MIKQLQF